MCENTHTNTPVNTHVHSAMHTHVQAHTCTHMEFIYMCTHTTIHTLVCTHVSHAHMHMHTCIHTNTSSLSQISSCDFSISPTVFLATAGLTSGLPFFLLSLGLKTKKFPPRKPARGNLPGWALSACTLHSCHSHHGSPNTG